MKKQIHPWLDGELVDLLRFAAPRITHIPPVEGALYSSAPINHSVDSLVEEIVAQWAARSENQRFAEHMRRRAEAVKAVDAEYETKGPTSSSAEPPAP